MLDQTLLIYYVAINLLAFVLYYVDKRRAINNQWRIPEKTLLGVAVVGGGLGAHLGMKVWHHKTQKTVFKIVVPLCILVHLALIVTYGYGLINLR